MLGVASGYICTWLYIASIAGYRVGGSGLHIAWLQSGMAMDRTPTKAGRRGAWGAVGGGARDLSKVWKKKEEICRKCEKRVNSGEMGLNCDSCRAWCHAECEKISRAEYELISKIDEKIKWFCRECSREADGIKEENKKLVKENEDLKEKNGELKMLVDSLEQRIKQVEGKCRDMLENEMKKVKQGLEGKLKSMFADLKNSYEEKIEKNRQAIEDVKNRKIEEMRPNKEEMKKQMEGLKQEIVDIGIKEVIGERRKEEQKIEGIQIKIEEMERERRRMNIVIFNLKESQKQKGEERYTEDQQRCDQIFRQELGVQNVVIEKLIRIGKRENERNRPLLVKLDNEERKREILKNTKKLRHSTDFERVYIMRDMTATEREKDRELRAELKERRQRENAEFTIRRGRVVKIERHLERRDAGTSELAEADRGEVGEDFLRRREVREEPK